MHNEKDKESNIYKDRYKLLFETAQDGILLINFEDGKVYDANKYFLEILGYNKADVFGKKLWELGFFEDIQVAKEAFNKLQTEGYLRYEDLPLRKKNGEKMETEFICNSYSVDSDDPNGPQKTIQCNVRNITDRKKTERKLEEYIEKLETLNKRMVGRELRMIELKEIIKKLKEETINCIKYIRNGN